MRFIATVSITAIIALSVLSGCDQNNNPLSNGALTNERAQHALDQWAPSNGTKTIQDVLDIPAQNAAKADVSITNMLVGAMLPGLPTTTYNGPATVIFVHYTDGRWVMKSISTPSGTWDNLNIEAK